MIHSITSIDRRVADAVENFSIYSDDIESIISANYHGGEFDFISDVVPDILNGRTSRALQTLIPLSIRKRAGLFFTGDRLAEKVASHVMSILNADTKIIDPACGAGNLLLACAKYLPMGSSLEETLASWATRLLGYDLYPEFIRAAQLRLMLLATSMHPSESVALTNLQPHNLFKGLEVGNAFEHIPTAPTACVVVNPPFGEMPSPVDCKWTTGKVQIAAWFIDKLIRSAHEGQHIVAILPDVLRSGTRYEKWRETISSLCTTLALEPAGRFDNRTDIDVFVLHVVAGEVKEPSGVWVSPIIASSDAKPKLSHYFDVHVGPVVPHRDPNRGPSYPYIHARTATAWQTVNHLAEERQYSGTVFSPPFVVVRRTSSPRDKHRSIATIINEQRNVAVENHLLVLLPRDKSLQSCMKLLNVLRTQYANDWFNERIRCRHLTVSAMRDFLRNISSQNQE